MAIRIKPVPTMLLLGFVALLLILANGVVLYSRYRLGDDYLGGFVPMFDLDMEKNVPTLFETFLILFNAILLATIGMAHRRAGGPARLWLLLAGIFVFLGTDEFVAIHEHLNRPLRSLVGASGPLFFAWVIPYALLVFLLGCAYLKFVLNLPPRPRWLLIVSFVCYVTGAMGFEMVGGWYFQLHDVQKDMLYGFMSTAEETLEMTGMILFSYTLLTYVEIVFGSIGIGVGDAPPR